MWAKRFDFISCQSKVQDDVIEAWNSTGGVYMLFRYQADPFSANKGPQCKCQIGIETKKGLEREKKIMSAKEWL
mgnify:CR=1 FL=1